MKQIFTCKLRQKPLYLSIIWLLIFSSSYGQNRQVSGKVTSEADGSGLPGVTVMIKGTTNGTVTDVDGNYRINVPQEGGILEFSFVGLQTKSLEIGSRSIVNVSLSEDMHQLDELVVTGYGTQIKQDLTGNLASITGKEIENVPVPTFEQAIQGRAAGVFVESNNGKLGQGMKIRIRGSSSVTANNQPLYVIDGIPVTSQSQSSSESATNPMADINFNDVESIEILKDASAAAIYGSRASNGVVLITTKKGKQGKTSIQVDAYTGFSEATHRRKFLNTAQYVELFTEAALNAGYTEDDIDEVFTEFGAGNPDSWQNPSSPDYVNTNWQNQVLQKGAINQVNVSANGGSEKTTFFVSGSYSDQKGLIKTNRFKRISGRANIEHHATDKLIFGANISLARTENHRLPNDDAFSTPMQIVALPPMTPVIDPRTNELSSDYTLYYNPLLNFKYSTNVATVLRDISNAYASYQLLPDLKFRSEFGVDILTQNEEQYYGSETSRNTGAANGYGYNGWVQVFNHTFNEYFNYNKTIGAQNLDATLGMSYQRSKRDQTYVEGQEFPSDAYRQISSAADITGGSSSETEFSFLSYFARANYKLKERYLASFSGRIDGSSRFGKNNRYGFFPAASLGWILSEEDFLANNQVLSFMKVRTSYGLTGNAEIGNFASMGLYSGDGGYAGETGQLPQQIANPNLKWEKTTQVDVGIDYGLFNDRITGELDFYIKKTKDLLLEVNVPATSGFTSQYENIGRLQNKGYEIVINTLNFVGEFEWSTSFNLSHNANKITNLNGQVIEDGYINRAIEGQSIGVFYAREYAGVDPENGDALYYLNTDLGNGKRDRGTTNDFNEAERVVIGNPNPDFYGGITNNFSYKGFDLSILFQGVFGNQIYNGAGIYQSASASYFDNQSADQMKRWQNPGDITKVPQVRLYEDNGVAASSRYLSDGSYVRLKTLTLGYRVPAVFINRAGIAKMRVYVTAQNLMTFTKYKGWDPEVNTDYLASNVSQGNDFYAAPQAKSVIVGVNIGF